MREVEQAVEPTKRVQFWVSADVPVSFQGEELKFIAHTLAIQASGAIEPGKTVEHGFETLEAH